MILTLCTQTASWKISQFQYKPESIFDVSQNMAGNFSNFFNKKGPVKGEYLRDIHN